MIELIKLLKNKSSSTFVFRTFYPKIVSATSYFTNILLKIFLFFIVVTLLEINELLFQFIS